MKKTQGDQSEAIPGTTVAGEDQSRPSLPVIEQAVLALWSTTEGSRAWPYRQVAERLNQEYGWNIQEKDIDASLEPSFEDTAEDYRQTLKNFFGYEPY